MDILMMLILPMHEHSTCFHLLASSLISFFSVVNTSVFVCVPIHVTMHPCLWVWIRTCTVVFAQAPVPVDVYVCVCTCAHTLKKKHWFPTSHRLFGVSMWELEWTGSWTHPYLPPLPISLFDMLPFKATETFCLLLSRGKKKYIESSLQKAEIEAPNTPPQHLPKSRSVQTLLCGEQE